MKRRDAIYIGCNYGDQSSTILSFKGVSCVKTQAGKDTLYHYYGDTTVRGHEVWLAKKYFNEHFPQPEGEWDELDND